MNSTKIKPRRKSFQAKNCTNDKENKTMALTRIASTGRVEQLFSEVRITACRTITNVKESFDGISQRILRSGPTKHPFGKVQQYNELNEKVTPVKLYSPFSFVTPSPVKSSRKKPTPKRISFQSPTGKLRKDVKQLSLEVKERERVEKALCNKRRR
ncbi:uncharacterized protein LOC129229670 [Uloborus diversus]|uniref:uncharacterized protein LOC129229670 n=1 Tax=Uloborus diversus TaxID=327109 RepID=UPI00240A09D8|nr:uncharacterized protein LOC129229670 [Uloborus diversus]